MKLIILNGPPGAGKDTFLDLLWEDGVLDVGGRLFEKYCYKHTLCEEAGKRHGMTAQQVWDRNADQSTKNLPSEDFGGMSVREALIYESEEVIKKKEGQDGVAIRTFQNLKAKYQDQGLDTAVFITASGGFNSETEAAIRYFGITRKDIFIVRIDRDGHSFEALNDSREYLNNPDLAFRNDYAVEDMKIFIPVIQQFINR